MLKPENYENLEKIYESARSLVYRATIKNDKNPVIIKLLNNPYPVYEDILKFTDN